MEKEIEINVLKDRRKEGRDRQIGAGKRGFRGNLGAGAQPAEPGRGRGLGLGAGLGAGPASVRPRTSSAVPVVPEAGSRLLRGKCGRRHAPPARPAPGFRWLHLRTVLAVDATAPRTETGLRRGDWRQVCGGYVGSGPSKEARFEDGVWELETRVSRSGASGAGVCG